MMAHSTLAVIRKLLNWYAVRDEEVRSPIVRGMGRIRPDERARQRVLSDDELRAVWKAASERTDPFAALINFLLLTAARRNEAGSLTWSEINGEEWLLPAKRNKVKIDFIRPLSAAALTVLKAEPQIEGCPYVFTHGKGQIIASYSRDKKAFDAVCGVAAWTLHDLRRTARTLLSRAGVSTAPRRALSWPRNRRRAGNLRPA